MSKTTLYHDGCNLCLAIEYSFNRAMGADANFESVNLGLDNARAEEAARLGVKRLPSLVIDGKVLRVDDHSPIEDFLRALPREGQGRLPSLELSAAADWWRAGYAGA